MGFTRPHIWLREQLGDPKTDGLLDTHPWRNWPMLLQQRNRSSCGRFGTHLPSACGLWLIANPAQCGTSSPGQWTLGDQGDNCVDACSYIGLSCDQNALNAQGHRNPGCIQALADDLGGTCNSVVHNTWTRRPAIEMGSSSCYYASSNGNSLCATIGSTNRRFCPCRSHRRVLRAHRRAPQFRVVPQQM